MNVKTAMAVPRWRANQLAMTAKAGSYKTAAPQKPISPMTSTNSGKLFTPDQSKTSSVAPSDPAVISSRAPCLSSQCPTGKAARPAMSSESENAPESSPRVQPSSASIGVMKTEKA